MAIAVAILGIALLVLLHEGGHFVVARALGMNPRKFYVGFPPALVKTTRNGIEYGIGAIPLGGYVKIPGMHRPAARDLDAHLARALQERPSLVAPLERVRQPLAEGDWGAARAALPDLESALAAIELPADAGRAAQRAIDDLRDALGPDAYWRAPTWKRVAVIFAGPGMNILVAVGLFAAALSLGTGTRLLGFSWAARAAVVQEVRAGWPADAIGLRPGDRVVAVDGRRLKPDALSARIRASDGAPVRLTIVRDGRALTLPAARTRRDTGLPPGQAVGEALSSTGRISVAIVKSLANLVHEKDRKQLSGTVGTVQISANAVRHGWRQYLPILGLISLSLALLNLLPLLPLDGGHIAFSLLEGVRRRAVAREVYERYSMIGIALVLLLAFIGLSNDIPRLGGG